jgi:hypothetical protein
METSRAMSVEEAEGKMIEILEDLLSIRMTTRRLWMVRKSRRAFAPIYLTLGCFGG